MAKKATPARSDHPEVTKILERLESADRQVLVILFIPSHDKDEKELTDQDQWADAALHLFAELYGGGTAFETYAGIYRDKPRGKDLMDKPILIESYTEAAKAVDPANLAKLVEFMKRMGNETSQAAVAVVIDNTFHPITDFA